MGREVLSNRYNLPETLVKAVLRDDHVTKGTLSVTELIDSPKIRYLKQLHDYEVDVSDKLYALVGTALHNILEKSDVDFYRQKAFITVAEALIQKGREFEGTAPEQAENLKSVAKYLFELIPVLFPEIGSRYRYEITTSLDIGDNYILSGTFDLYDTLMDILYDYKFCSVYQYIYPESRKKWAEQTNIYAYMLAVKHGYNVKGIRIIAFFRNWDAYGVHKDKNYPPRQTLEVIVPMMTAEQVTAMIERHKQRHLLIDKGQVPECNGEDRWASAAEYAVMVVNGKRAKFKAPSAQLANKYIEDNRHKTANMYVEERPGVSRRCENYCVVSKVCPQFRREQEALNKEVSTDKAVEQDEFAR